MYMYVYIHTQRDVYIHTQRVQREYLYACICLYVYSSLTVIIVRILKGKLATKFSM